MARQLLRGPRLADAGLAGEHDDSPVSRARLLEGAAQHLELALPPDKRIRRCRRPGVRGARPDTGSARLLRRRREMAGDRNAVDMHRPGDVLDLLRAAIREADVEPVADLVAHHPADADLAGLGQGFEAGGDVDAVAVDVALVEDHVAQIDADAELDPSSRRHVGVALGHRPLQLDGAAHRIDDARKLDEQPVAGGLDDAAPMLLDLGVRELAPDRLQRGERAPISRE